MYMQEMIRARRTSEKREARHDLFSSLLDANEDEAEAEFKLTDSKLIGASRSLLPTNHSMHARRERVPLPRRGIRGARALSQRSSLSPPCGG